MELLFRGIRGAFDRITDYLAVFAGVLVMAATIIVTTDVILRKFLNHPIIWSTEFTGYMVAWIAFLAASWILRRNEHIGVDLVLRMLAPKTQTWLTLTTSTIGAIICLILTIYGTQLVWYQFQQNIHFSTITQPPKAPLLAVIPLSSLLLFIQFVRKCYSQIQSFANHS